MGSSIGHWPMPNLSCKTLEVYCEKEDSLNLKEETLIVGYKVVMRLLQRTEDRVTL
jgi:hypothetical protein